MRSFAFVLIFLLSFLISLQIPYLQEHELLSLVLSCFLAGGVVTLSKHEILDFSKVTIKSLYYAFILGFLYGCMKFCVKYYVFGHMMGNSQEVEIQVLAETLIFIVLIIPLLEEFFFRGILFDDIKRVLGNNAAVVLTSLSFIALHIKNFTINPLYESIFLMLPGVCIYVYLKLKTNNFLVSYAAHLTHNLTVFLLLLLVV